MADSTLTVRIEGQDTLSSELKTAQSNVIRFVGAVSSALAALGGIAFPVLESARFQRELLETGKTTDFTKGQLEELKKELVDLSTQINVTAVDLAKIATMGGQMGIGGNGNVSALGAFVEEVARAVTALDMPAEQAVMALGKLINIFNVPAAKFRNLISSLNQVSNTSNATAEELFDVTRRIGNLGGAVNMPEAAALSASMIDLGQTAETAGTTLTKVFADMRSKAGEFAAFIGGDMTEQKWVDMLQGKGLAALDMYLDRLNEIAPAAAAAAKVDLTGGGRIFEAITKLQAQRQRATLLEADAAREQALVDANAAKMTEQEVKQAEARVKSLRDLAKEANIVSRLTKEATDAYTSGDSAMKEQQTVLSGLIAQWDVFLNNARKAAMGLGDAVLLPLTNLLRNMSDALRSIDMDDQLGNAMRDMMETMQMLAEYTSYFVQDVKSISTGVDWGGALKVAVMLAAVTALRLLGAGLGAFRNHLAQQIPLLSRLSSTLFGTSAAMRDAQVKAEELAKSHERTGGALDRVTSRMATYVGQVTQVTQLNARAGQTQNAINSAQQVHAQRLQAVGAAYAGVGKRLQNQQALMASIATAQARLDAAQVAGNNRAIARNAGIVASQTAVLAAVQAAQARADSAARAISRMQDSLDRTQASATSLNTAGVRMALAFEQARDAGQGLFSSMRAAASAGAGSGPAWISAIPTQITAARAAIANFMQATASAFNQGTRGATGFAGAVRGATASVNFMTTALHVAFTGAVSAGLARTTAAINVLGDRVLRLALEVTGTAAQWDAATTRMARGVVLVNAALQLTSKALVAVRNAMLSLVSVAFIGLMVKDLLQFLGLWDKVLDGFAKVYEFFGGSRDNLPKWMQSSKQIAQVTKATDEYAAALAAQREEAGKYNKVAQTTLKLMASGTSSTSLLQYNADDPTKALSQMADGLEAIMAAQSKLAENTETLTTLESRYVELGLERVAMERALNEARGGAGETTARRNLQEVEASLRNVIAALKERKEVEADLSLNQGPAIQNVTRALFSQADAFAVLSRASSTGGSLLENYTEAQAKLLEVQSKLELLRSSNQSAYRAPTDSGGQAEAEKYRLELEGLEAAMRSAEATAKQARGALTAAIPTNIAALNLADGLAKSTDANAVRAVGRRMADVLADGIGEFSAIAVPPVTMDTLVEAGAVYQTSAQLRKMYDDMAAVATAKANQAKQAVTVSLEEVRRALKQSEAAVASFDRAWRDSQRLQSDYKVSQGEQKRLRERLSEIDAEEAAEIRRAERVYGFNADMLRREKLYIEENYRAKREAAQNTTEGQAAKRQLDYEKKDYDELVAKVNGYRKAIEDANKVLTSPNLGLKAAEEATSTIEKESVKAKEAIAELDRMRVAMAGREPIGGKLFLTTQDIEKMRADAQSLGTSIAKAQGDAASSMEGVYKRMANDYSELSRGYEQGMIQAEQVIRSYALTHESSMEKVINDLTTALASTDDYTKAMQELDRITRNIRLSPETLDPDALRGVSKTIASNLSAIVGESPATFVVTPDRTALKNSIAEQFKDLNSAPEGQRPTVNADVKPVLDDSAGKALRGDVADALKEPFGISVTPNISGTNTRQFARGGFVDALKSFATGGKVTGPGTGTSDSILARLSNGEFVMDALTTRTFGANFFAKLQALARSGRSSELKLPGFARGGQVGNPFSGSGAATGIPPLAESVGASAMPTDVVNINLNTPSGRVSLFAERKQAGRLVDVFKTMETGT